jgi:hypothetical protein
VSPLTGGPGHQGDCGSDQDLHHPGEACSNAGHRKTGIAVFVIVIIVVVALLTGHR